MRVDVGAQCLGVTVKLYVERAEPAVFGVFLEHLLALNVENIYLVVKKRRIFDDCNAPFVDLGLGGLFGILATLFGNIGAGFIKSANFVVHRFAVNACGDVIDNQMDLKAVLGNLIQLGANDLLSFLADAVFILDYHPHRKRGCRLLEFLHIVLLFTAGKHRRQQENQAKRKA